MNSLPATATATDTAAATPLVDEIRFFTLVANLFPPRFLFGASVLLASYDDENAPYSPDPSTGFWA